MEDQERELASISIRLSEARGLVSAGRRNVLSAGTNDALAAFDDELGPVLPIFSDIVVALDKVDEMIEKAQEPIRTALARLYSEGTKAAVLAAVTEPRP